MSDTLPKGWTIAKLGEIGVCVTGNTPSKSNPLFYGNEIPFIKPPQVNNGLISESSEFLSSEGGKKARLLPTNSILVTCIGNLGRVGINKTPIAFNQQINAIIPSEVYEPKLLFYQAMSSQFKTQLESYSAATTVAIVNKGNFEKIIIPLPPLNEQKRILAKLEQLLTDLDKGIEYLETTKQQLKVYRESVLKWAFEGKLTNKDVKDGELPKGWVPKKVSELCDVVRGGSPRPAGDPKFYNGNIPFLKVADLTSDNSVYLHSYEFTIKEAGLQKTRKIYPETLLLTNSGATLGVPKICMIEATMNDGIAAFLNLDKRSNLYLYYYWESKTQQLRNINQGAAQPNLNTDIIKNYIVPYCSFEQQSEVVKSIESRLSVCDKIEETIESSLQQAEALRLSIIKKAFEGKLVPQDPNDEPAEQLLERIKALRHSSAKTTTRVRSQPAATDRKKKGKITDRRKVK